MNKDLEAMCEKEGLTPELKHRIEQLLETSIGDTGMTLEAFIGKYGDFTPNKTKKLYVSDLSYVQLKKVWIGNQGFRKACIADFEKSVMTQVSKYLNYIQTAVSASIGFYQNNYLYVTDSTLFLDGLTKLQKEWCFFDTNDRDFLLETYEFYFDYFRNYGEENDIFSDDEENSDFLDELETRIKQLSRCALEVFNQMINGGEADVFCHCNETYVVSELLKTAYVIDLDNPVVYEDQYIKFN